MDRMGPVHEYITNPKGKLNPVLVLALTGFWFPVCREVEKAVHAAQSLHRRWVELQPEVGGASREEADWTTNELRNGLRSIEWDLEDLDETISILVHQSVLHSVPQSVSEAPVPCLRSP